jgi:hypothetical protein
MAFRCVNRKLDCYSIPDICICRNYDLIYDIAQCHFMLVASWHMLFIDCHFMFLMFCHQSITKSLYQHNHVYWFVGIWCLIPERKKTWIEINLVVNSDNVLETIVSFTLLSAIYHVVVSLQRQGQPLSREIVLYIESE